MGGGGGGKGESGAGSAEEHGRSQWYVRLCEVNCSAKIYYISFFKENDATKG